MKITIESIKPRSDDTSPRMNVLVHVQDEGELPLRNAEFCVFVDKSVTDIDEIRKEAIRQVVKFATEIGSEKA